MRSGGGFHWHSSKVPDGHQDRFAPLLEHQVHSRPLHISASSKSPLDSYPKPTQHYFPLRAAKMSSPVVEKEQQPFLRYTDDATIDDNESETGRRQHPLEGPYSRLLSCCLVFLLTSALWITVMYLTSPPSKPTNANNTYGSSPAHRHNITSNSKLLKCGNSTAEAKALGCRYDILLNHWVPSQCWDQEMIDEYQDDDSWTAYYDEALTQPIKTIDEMGDRDHYWTSARDHINHCAMMWKKQFWVMFEDRSAMDSLVAGPGHTDHCAQYLMDASLYNFTLSTRVEIGFAGCWIRSEI